MWLVLLRYHPSADPPSFISTTGLYQTSAPNDTVSLFRPAVGYCLTKEEKRKEVASPFSETYSSQICRHPHVFTSQTLAHDTATMFTWQPFLNRRSLLSRET